MKTLIAIFLLSSCTVIHHPVAGTFATVGGDTQGLSVTTNGFSMQNNNNSTAVLQGGKMIKDAVMWSSIIGAGKDLLQPSATATGNLINSISP